MTLPFDKDIKKIQNVLKANCRYFSSGSKHIQKKILVESRQIKMYCICSLIYSLITHLCFIPIHKDADIFNSYYVSMIRHLGQMPKSLVVFFMSPPLIVNAYTTNMVVTNTMYIAYQMKFQLDLLKDFIEHDINCSSLKSTKNVQKTIEKKLKQCAKFYAHLQR